MGQVAQEAQNKDAKRHKEGEPEEGEHQTPCLKKKTTDATAEIYYIATHSSAR
jgi:hypothetical protein